ADPPHPTPEQLRAEADEEEPTLLLTVSDADGKPVRVLTAPATAGLHRITWDLRLPAVSLPRPRPEQDAAEDLFGPPPGGTYAAPGKYSISVAKRVDGVVTPLAGPVEFRLKYVGAEPLSEADMKELVAFQREVIKLQRDLTAAQGVAGELTTRLDQIKAALDQTAESPATSRERIRRLIAAQRDTVRLLSGDAVMRGRNENTLVSIAERVGA